MNAETAAALLPCYRPGMPGDSRTQKAVRFAEQDPELKKKLADQVAFDAQIIDVIHYITPPENLRQKLSELSAKPRAEKAQLRKQLINPAVLTAVLGLLLMAGIGFFFVRDRMEKFPGRENVEGLLATASKMTGDEFEQLSKTTSEIGDWLYMHGYEGYEAPPEIAALPVVGSRVFRYDGRTVAQMAIDAHSSLLYQFHASEFSVILPPDSDWQLLEKDDWVGAVRQHGDHCFLLVFRGEKDEMREFLKALPKKK